MLSILAELHFSDINIISVAYGLDSNDEGAKLGIQIRGVFNELQLQDLKKKTFRGLIGQKKRGFSVGERSFGYKSVPFGKTVMDQKGNPIPEDYKFEIGSRESSRRARPGQIGKHDFSRNQGSQCVHNPVHMLSGILKYSSCGSTITQISGKSGGCYGCFRAQKGVCTNTVIVRRTLTEKITLNKFYKISSSPELIHDVLQKLEKEIENLYTDIPESIRLTNKELRPEECRLNKFVEFIAEGRSSHTISKTLEASEQRVDIPTSEIEGLKETRN